MAKRPYIAELDANRFIDGIFAVYNTQLGMTRNGKPFLKCLLGDKTGRAPARMWNASEQLFQSLPTDGFVWVEGQTQAYQGEMQIIIQQIRTIEPGEEDMFDLLPSTQRDIDQMYEQVVAMLDTVEHMPLRHIIEAFASDEALMDRFCRAPAAMTLHHAYIGGLLEHTLMLMQMADAICPLYPQINRDVVLTGLFLHDLGKCAELKWSTGFGYTDEGLLVGHIVQGVLWLEEKARQCREKGRDIPEPLLMVLKHIILSHHGKPEFGAARIPSTPEALAVSLLDNVDARLQMAIAAAREPAGAGGDMGGNFTEKIWALETRLYRPDPTEPMAAAVPEVDGSHPDEAAAVASQAAQKAPATSPHQAPPRSEKTGGSGAQKPDAGSSRNNPNRRQ